MSVWKDDLGSSPPMIPMRIEPIFKTALWGGHRLRSMLGFQSSAEPTGEAWVFCDQDSTSSKIAEGPAQGITVQELVAKLPREILGKKWAHLKRIPLLLKFIDAKMHLSVQVHPNDALAQQLEGKQYGKTEAWLILDAAQGGKIFAGLKPGITAADLERGIADGSIEEMMLIHHPVPGDCFVLKAGKVHAIGAGIMLFEIQQPSDITYRLYDWGRVDATTGLPRELHIEKGLKSIDYANQLCEPVQTTNASFSGPRCQSLVLNQYFKMGQWETDQPFEIQLHDEFLVLVMAAGKAILEHQKRQYSLAAGSVWLLPAGLKKVPIVPQGEIKLLECGIC